MAHKNEQTERFGGPGSSHQDREHPGKNHQPTGKKGGGDTAGTPATPGAPTNADHSRVSGGGGEQDSHHTHTRDRSWRCRNPGRTELPGQGRLSGSRD